MMLTDDGPQFFISRAGSDSDVAKAVDQVLRNAGYRTYVQDHDFGHSSFMARMAQGWASGAKLICLLSSAYQQSEYCKKEYEVALSNDPRNLKENVVVLRIGECHPLEHLADLRYIDLVPLLSNAGEFARAVLEAVAGGRDDRRKGAIDPISLHRRAPVSITHPIVRAVGGFTGREAELDWITSALWDREPAMQRGEPTITAALHGMAGTGKSVLAQEWAWRSRARYRGVWWLRAERRETLMEDLVDLAKRVVPACDPGNREAATQLILDTIAHDVGAPPWLLVYDNVESPGSIGHLTPRGGAHVLVTTRWSDWPSETRALPIDVFTRETAIAFLLAKANTEDERSAGDLATALGYLPLALSHARSACWRMNWRFTKYVAHVPEMVSKVPRDATYSATVYSTIDLAISTACSRVPKVEELLGFASFCDPDDVPMRLITRGVMSDIEYGEATAALDELSLISQDRERRRVSVHRLVQEVVRARLREQGNFAKLGALCLDVLAGGAKPDTHDGVIDGPFAASSSWRTALQHAADCNAEAARFLFAKLGFEGITRRAFEEAEADFRAAIETSETRQLERSKLATDLNNLAAFLLYRQRLDEAETCLGRALDILKGPGSDVELALILDNLGVLRELQSKPAEAAEFYRRSIQIREASDPVDYEELLGTVGNQCDVLLQFDDAAAVPVLRRAVKLLEEIEAASDPFFRHTRGEWRLHRALRMLQLAQICSNGGELQEVECLAQIAVDLCLETDLDSVALGFSCRLQVWHPRTDYPARLAVTGGSASWIAVLSSSLALLEHVLGQSSRQRELIPRLERVVGAVRQREHLREPRALDHFDKLAYLYFADDQFDKVAQLMEEASQLAKSRSCGGRNEEGGRLIMRGAALARLERYDEAERSMRAAVSVLEAEQNADPRNLRIALGNLISLLQASGTSTEIDALRKRLAAIEAGGGPASA